MSHTTQIEAKFRMIFELALVLTIDSLASSLPLAQGQSPRFDYHLGAPITPSPPNPALQNPGAPRKQIDAPEAVRTVPQGQLRGRARSCSGSTGSALENAPGASGNT